MDIKYDPSDDDYFWTEISKIPGYPKDEIKPIQIMLFRSNAIYKTTGILKAVGAKQENPLIVVMDGMPMKRGSDALKKVFLEMLTREGWLVTTVILTPDKIGQIHTDMPHIQAVKSYLSPGSSVLSIGSGVVTDVAKHASFLFQSDTGISLPFVVFQTANSVSAFTSSLAPVFMDGVKRTLNSRYPNALICDLETLAAAPREMTVAGVGDMLARFVSLPDWYLANQLGMDPGYSEFSNTLLGPLDEIFLDHAKDINNCTIEGMSVLSKIIALGGLAMSLSHATTPMSGFEHVMSHVLDLQFELRNQPLPQHGSQVALATIVGLEMYHHFLDEFNPKAIDLGICYLEPETMRKQIMDSFNTIDPSGKAGEECWSDYKQKLDAWELNRENCAYMLLNWANIKSRLQEDICASGRIIQILKAIKAPLDWDQLNPPVSENSARFAFLNASLMRKRLTIGDLLIFTNWNRGDLWEKIGKNIKG